MAFGWLVEEVVALATPPDEAERAAVEARLFEAVGGLTVPDVKRHRRPDGTVAPGLPPDDYPGLGARGTAVRVNALSRTPGDPRFEAYLDDQRAVVLQSIAQALFAIRHYGHPLHVRWQGWALFEEPGRPGRWYLAGVALFLPAPEAAEADEPALAGCER
jgi:hypothetical protein